MINWNVSKEDHELILKIADRVIAMSDGKVKKQSVLMDLTACHANGCRLKLEELLNAPISDFAHDIIGISSHLDRTTGNIGGCFLPRYAEAQ